ncbi:helix-turn-helix domain-containing protein, partial [Nannocystis radixulma]
MTEGRGDHHDEGAEFVSGKEAAALLGVKRETLYAYASRGLVRSEPGGAGRERRYSRDDLERLKARRDARSGHGPVAAGALRWGEPVLESALTAIEAAGPRYRGRPAVELAEATSFEAVAELLWSGVLPEQAPRWSVAGL